MRVIRLATGIMGVACAAVACGWMIRLGEKPVAAAGYADAPCKDPMITRAVREVMGRPANGSGDTGECNPRNYGTDGTNPQGQTIRGNGVFSSYQDCLNKVVVKLTRKGVAYVFDAPSEAVMQGHVAWAYMLDNGTYALGATDADDAQYIRSKYLVWKVPATLPKGHDTNTPWRSYAATEADLFKQMYDHYPTPEYKYKEYKWTYVANRNAGAAEGKTIELRDVGYGLVGNNCLDHVYSVLEAYGTQKDDVMQWKQTHAAPNSWFRAFGSMDLNGTIHKIDNQPGAAVPQS